MSSSTKKILCLFDVDGTLTKPRQKIDKHFDQFLSTTIKPLCNIAIVGGSDLNKIVEQMDGDDVIHRFDYVFSENGLVAYKYGKQLNCESIQRFLGEEKLQSFINFVLNYLSTLHLPIKRGTFIEFRQGMLNISPIGRNCSRQERDDFEKYDKVHKIRQTMIDVIRDHFPDYNLTYSIGGQISFDVFPNGWDKTYCLRHLENDGFDEIHFFGDKTDKGGNDYEIYIDNRIIGHKVRDPDDTKRELLKLFNLN